MGLLDKKEEAIRPSFFTLPTFIRDEEAVKRGLSDEERVLAAGSNTEFWLALRTRIKTVVDELERVNEQAIAAGIPLEEIGRNTVVINQTKGVLKRIFDFVEDAREAVEQNGK